MPTVVTQALVFLTDTLFNLYLYILVIRLMLVWVNAEYTLPLTQFVVKTTTFLVKPLRSIVPDYRRLEGATVLLIFIVSLLKQIVHLCLTFGFSHVYSIIGIVLLTISDPIQCFLTILCMAILFQALLSWLQPNTRINQILYQITQPILRPIQRAVPLIGGLDISPVIAIILLQLLMILFVIPLAGMGASIAVS